MSKHFFKISFLMLMCLSLSTSFLWGQRKYSVVVDDIIGIDGAPIPRYEIEGESFELTITSFKYHFNMARVDVIDRSISPFPLTRYFYKPYDGDVFTDFYVDDLEYNKVYELRITYMIYDQAQAVKRIRIIRRQ